MADKRISELLAASSVTAGTLLASVSSLDVTEKATAQQVKDFVNKSSADDASSKSGNSSLSSGISSIAIVFTTPFSAAPTNVIPTLRVPSGGDGFSVWIDDSTVSTTGFTAVFGGTTPTTGYKLNWKAEL